MNIDKSPVANALGASSSRGIRPKTKYVLRWAMANADKPPTPKFQAESPAAALCQGPIHGATPQWRAYMRARRLMVVDLWLYVPFFFFFFLAYPLIFTYICWAGGSLQLLLAKELPKPENRRTNHKNFVKKRAPCTVQTHCVCRARSGVQNMEPCKKLPFLVENIACFNLPSPTILRVCAAAYVKVRTSLLISSPLPTYKFAPAYLQVRRSLLTSSPQPTCKLAPA